MGIGPSYKIVVDLSTPGQQQHNDSDLDWIAKPPQEGEARIPPLFEKDLVAGDGPILGKGAYGVTRLSKSSFTGEYYAVKVLTKAPIFEKKSIIIVQAEVDTLARMQHPFIVHLFGVHQDDVRVALVMEYAAGGELLHRIRKRLRLPDAEAKFYAAEIADALQYMHNEVGIIYHDLKPENILLAADGHVKVVDFGLALDAEARQWDECRMGTSMYMAPELAKHRVQGAHAPAVDWWSFGCVVYEMLSGALPFGDSADLTKYEIYTNITEKKLRFGKGFGSKSKKLLRSLLDKNPETRLGWEGVQEHAWFRNVDWVALRKRRIFPPWVPTGMKPGCTECFLQWKPEPQAGAGEAGGAAAAAAATGEAAAAGGGGEHAYPPSDQAQEYSRIIVPRGCALRPPPPPQPPATGKAKGASNFQRVVLETMGGKKGSTSSSTTGRYSGTAGRYSGTASGGSLDPSVVMASKRGSNEADGVVGSSGGGNAKRRFKSAAARVASSGGGSYYVGDRQHHTDARAGAAGAGGCHRPTPHGVASRHHRHTNPGGGGGGGGGGGSNAPTPSRSKQPLREVGYR